MRVEISTTVVLLFLAALNVAGVGIMWWDKFRARTGGWRVPEKTLLGLALVGGSVGVLAGMRWFRHKTKHPQFYIGVPVIIALQVAVVAYLLFR